MNYNEANEEYTFSKSAVDGLLRSCLFATTQMIEGLPEHAYNYIESKSNEFFGELIEQYESNEDLKNYLSGNR